MCDVERQSILKGEIIKTRPMKINPPLIIFSCRLKFLILSYVLVRYSTRWIVLFLNFCVLEKDESEKN
jgi:hypothetical protein